MLKNFKDNSTNNNKKLETSKRYKEASYRAFDWE